MQRLRLSGVRTDTFPVKQNIHQRGILSTQEYKCFINPLLQLLEYFKIGGCIGGINFSAPTCADDVCVTAHSPADLQVLLDVAGTYSKSEHHIVYNQLSVWSYPFATQSHHGADQYLVNPFP